MALDSGEEFTTLVNPNGVDIQLAAYRAHGISMQDVEHASVPTFRCSCIARSQCIAGVILHLKARHRPCTSANARF